MDATHHRSKTRRTSGGAPLLRQALLLCSCLAVRLVSAVHIEVNITVPEFHVDEPDTYLCVAALLPPNPHKLVGVVPRAKQEVVHHILLYGERGAEPASPGCLGSQLP